MTQRLVQWDGFEVRLSGERAQAVARKEILKRGLPLDQLGLEFRNGEIRVKARLRAAFPVPFSFVIRKIQASERAIRLFVEDMSAFGFLPVPAILSRLAGDRQAAEGIRFDAATNSVFIQLDRFLPTFMEVEVAEINMIDGGLTVRVGQGGADLPPEEIHATQI
jgi:hypothetical protein